MALSRQQRRALREIEEHLAAEDPTLATLLRRAGATRLKLMRRFTRAVVVVAVTLLLLGLLLSDLSMVGGGLLMLVILLVARRLGSGCWAAPSERGVNGAE